MHGGAEKSLQYRESTPTATGFCMAAEHVEKRRRRRATTASAAGGSIIVGERAGKRAAVVHSWRKNSAAQGDEHYCT